MKLSSVALTLGLVVVVPAQEPATEKLFFVVDKSCSMTTEEASFAINQFCDIAMSADISLEVEINVVAFGKDHKSWGRGWQKMPSHDTLMSARRFLEAPGVHTNETRVIPPLRRAMMANKKELTVVLISDGNFGDSDENITSAIKRTQKLRVLKGLPRALVGCVGVETTPKDSLKKIAHVGGAGYISYFDPDVEEEEDE